MREMQDVWKELQRRGGEAAEAEPLSKPRSAAAAAAPPAAAVGRAASYKATAGDAAEERDWFETGFTLRDLGPQAIRVWLGLQVVALCFQLLLWNEVSLHLSEFEDALTRECSGEHQHHGVCLGPMWNISTWQDVVLRAGGPAAAQSFAFSTSSSPPTFLLVVDPVSWAKALDTPAAAPELLSEQVDDLREARWSLEVVRTKPPQVGASVHHFHAGQEALTFEDLSVEARGAGRAEWRATLTARGPASRSLRYVTFVEDAAISHLEQVRASPQCAFGRSWKAFNEQHQGHSHRTLSWCRFLLGLFLLVGAAAVYAVHTELGRGPLGHRFHLVVVSKFLLQDVPQQICIVLYLLGWYEGSGLRCQLCLFQPHHCGDEGAFHAANAAAVLCTLLSSVANQLLVRPAFKRTYTEDDFCVQGFVRVSSLCVSVLPFTTGICLASRSLLPAPTLLHLSAAVPCGIGWITLLGLACVPFTACCDEDYDVL